MNENEPIDKISIEINNNKPEINNKIIYFKFF